MERTIISQDDLDDPATRTLTTQTTKDDYLARVVKMIPAEVVAVYLFVDGAIKGLPVKPEPPATAGKGPYFDIVQLSWIFFFVFLVATWAYMHRVAKVKKIRQVAESTLAFAVWVFAIGGPFIYWSNWLPSLGGIAVALYTFGLPIVDPKAGKLKP